MMTLQLEDRFINECELVKKTFLSKNINCKNTMDFNYMSFVNEIHKDIDTRITLIAEDGTVKADTHEDPVNMNNHLNRKEVIDAIRTDKVGTFCTV